MYFHNASDLVRDLMKLLLYGIEQYSKTTEESERGQLDPCFHYDRILIEW